MHFRSMADLNRDVARWSEQIPRDIDLIVGIPRSGMLAASLLALHMNRPLIDLDGFCAGRRSWGGRRTSYSRDSSHALVVDDSIWSGAAIREARAAIAVAAPTARVSYGVIYTDPDMAAPVDFSFAHVPMPRVFEWNVLHHGRLGEFCMDIDGVLCRDPEMDENDDGPRYLEFLQTVAARLVPAGEVGWLVTSRLDRYRHETESWLKANGIRYRHLLMHPAATGGERRAANDHGRRKAAAYRRTGAILFIESSSTQADEIARLSGKSVYCTDTRQMIQPPAAMATLATPINFSYSFLGKARRRLATLENIYDAVTGRTA